MIVTCLDLEGVLVPEIWIAFADAVGIKELRRTTRDEPDYNKLMEYRLGILKENGLGFKRITEVINTLKPMEGAREFLDELRAFTQVIILSDTFEQFAGPLMEKLGRPTILCNTLLVGKDGSVEGYKMRCANGKLATVKALQSVGCKTIATGDSYNDIAMIRASMAGFLFRSTPKIIADNADIPSYSEYNGLLAAIRKAVECESTLER